MNQRESQERRDWVMKRHRELQPLIEKAPDLANALWDALVESWGDKLEPVHVHDVVREFLFPGPQPSADEVAHHEAAHAVVAAAVGCEVTFISIALDIEDGSLGGMRYSGDKVRPEAEIAHIMRTSGADWDAARDGMLDRLVSEAAIQAAGPLAQMELAGSEDPDTGWREEIRELILRRAARSAEEEAKLLERTLDRARDIIERNREVLEALVAALHEERILTITPIEAFFEAHPVKMVPEPQRIPDYRERVRRYGPEAAGTERPRYPTLGELRADGKR